MSEWNRASYSPVIHVHCSLNTCLLANQLGKLIRSTRASKGLGLRALARAIDKSPTFIVSIELDEDTPSVGDETLLRIADVLDLRSELLFALAKRTPSELNPTSELDVLLYQAIKRLSELDKQELLDSILQAGNP